MAQPNVTSRSPFPESNPAKCESTPSGIFALGAKKSSPPVEDRKAARALDAARRERLSGKSLTNALGFEPQYLLVTVSPPRDGHCYKVCAAVLPSG